MVIHPIWVALVSALVVVGCTSGSQDDSVGSTSVTPYEISRELAPLLDAVSRYTNTDYGAGDQGEFSPEVDAAIKKAYTKIEAAEQRWLVFVAGLDFETVPIPGLSPAVREFNGALNDWQIVQNSNMTVWDECLAAGGDDKVMSLCLLAGVDVAAEQAVLDEYIAALTSLFEVLNIPVPSQ